MTGFFCQKLPDTQGVMSRCIVVVKQSRFVLPQKHVGKKKCSGCRKLTLFIYSQDMLESVYPSFTHSTPSLLPYRQI